MPANIRDTVLKIVLFSFIIGLLLSFFDINPTELLRNFGATAEKIFEIVAELNQEEGVTFLLAEQNTNMALRYAKYGYILENGRVVLDGEAKDLRENEDVKEFYLGISGGDKKSFRDVKAYRRRKRWLA